MFIDGSNFVDDHVPRIRKHVWAFIKRQGEGVSYEELMPVAYEAARQAGETFDPSLGFVYATHCRKRIEYALLDYLGDRNQVVKDMELPEPRYARAWGDPDAKPRGRTKKTRPLVEAVSYENGNRVTRYATGPYRSSPQLIRGLGAVTSKHNKVGFTPIQTQFGDGWHKPSDGTSWRRALVEDDGNQGVTDPRLVLWAGEKEAKGKEKVAPADYSDWKRIWAANYTKHCQPPARLQLAPSEPDRKADLPEVYKRLDGASMVQIAENCYRAQGDIPTSNPPGFYAPVHSGYGGLDQVMTKWGSRPEPLPVTHFLHARAPGLRRRVHLIANFRRTKTPVVNCARWDYTPGTVLAGDTGERLRVKWAEAKKRLRAEMIAAHPDKGGGHEAFIEARRRYDEGVDLPNARPAVAAVVATPWRPDPRKQYRERNEWERRRSVVRVDLRLTGRDLETGDRIWAEQPIYLMSNTRFHERYYDYRQDIKQIGDIWEVKPARKMLGGKHLVPINRETAMFWKGEPWRLCGWNEMEIGKYTNRWERDVHQHPNYFSVILKKERLGRYNRQEQNSTTAPRPPVLAAALLGGSQSDRRASLNDRLTFISQQLDILNRGVALLQDRVDAMIRPYHSNDESHRRERPY